MAYIHDIKLTPQTDRAKLSDSDHSMLRQRIASLKQQNTSLFYAEVPEAESADESYQQIADACDQFIKSRSAEDEDNLATVLSEHNLHLYCYKYDETSRDKRNVARMAFTGRVDRPTEYELSPLFRDMKNHPLERPAVKPEDYDLSYSSVWNVFKQVPEFEVLEPQIKKGLASFGIVPEKLSELNLKDFCFVINQELTGGYGNSAKVFKQSYKARNTIRFINENEDEFRQGLLSMPDVRRDYVEALIGCMKRGITDLTKARNRDGSPMWKPEWQNQPVVDVHHIVNIKDAATREQQGESFVHINDYNNMCFIVRHPQHDAMHAFEQDLNGNYHEDIFYNRNIDKKYIYRIQPPEGVRCMLGFNSMIYDRDYLQLEKKQKKQLQEQKRQDPFYYRNRPGRHDALRKEEKHNGGRY